MANIVTATTVPKGNRGVGRPVFCESTSSGSNEISEVVSSEVCFFPDKLSPQRGPPDRDR